MKKINRNLSLTTRPNEQFSINLGGSYGPENKPSLKITYSGNAQRDQDIGVEGLGSHVMVSDEILKQLRNLKERIILWYKKLKEKPEALLIGFLKKQSQENFLYLRQRQALWHIRSLTQRRGA